MSTELQTQIIGEIGTIITILTPLLGVIIAIFKLKINTLIESKINLIKDEKLRKLAQGAVTILEDLVTKEITNADLTLKPIIIQKIANGEMSKKDIDGIKDIVKDNVVKQLTEDSKIALSNVTQDFNQYLDSYVESRLGELKIDPASPVSKTVIPELAANPKSVAELDLVKEELKRTKVELANTKAKLDTIQSVVSPITQTLDTPASAPVA